MGIQKKHGKGRLDKWYKLAKEKGYRARAAFKLVQLNRRYGFLEKSKVLLDLCAAPGSWCQVAAEAMPTNSLIVGVDLAPIKPIPRVTTFQSDITSDKCRATIRQHFKTWKADTVLHDGAPNVGTAWVQDAYSQAELVLQALKLATEFLIGGGTFVTKVFRSKDYNALLWVFNQLFGKVEATKPPSSRNVSAEIFVVCRDFKAPKRIDPKFLDPRAVFAELTAPTPNNEAKVFNPEVKKRKREGYEEGDYTQFKEALASDFVHTTDPIAMLGSLNRLTFEAPKGNIALTALNRLPETTDEIKQCCNDLKVLGRKDFRMLLRWRLKAREIFGLSSKVAGEKTEMGDEVAEVTPMDEDLKIQEDLERLAEQESARRKRQRRRENEKKQKEIVRMQLNMTTPSDIGLDQSGPLGDSSMFNLTAVNKAGAVNQVARGRMAVPIETKPIQEQEDDNSEAISDDEEDALDEELDDLYSQYKERKAQSDAKYSARNAREEHADGEWGGLSDDAQSTDEEFDEDEASGFSSDEEQDEARQNHFVRSHQAAEGEQNGLSRRAAQFFQQDVFKGIGNLSVAGDTAELNDQDQDLDHIGEAHSQNRRTRAEGRTSHVKNGASSTTTVEPLADISDQEDEVDGETELRREVRNVDADSDGDEELAESFESVKPSIPDWDAQGEPRKDGRLDIDIITAEAMTLAQQVALGQKTTHDLVDDGFNKYTFRDRDGLPDWFMEDEDKHSKPQRPITAAAAAAIKEKLRALNARPIKKVQEAKDRKKFRAARRLEKLRKKSALVADEEGVSERDKAQNIAKLMNKAAKKKPKQSVSVVVAKGGNRGISGRPRGVKGKYKIVDARLKKDVRAQKRLAKKKR